MLIFHAFASLSEAEAFAASVQVTNKLSATVYETQEASNAVDPFPWRLTPPIVLVERTDEEGVEESLEEKVKCFGGSFAGT